MTGLFTTDSTITESDFIKGMSPHFDFLYLENTPNIKSYDVLGTISELKYLQIKNYFTDKDLNRLTENSKLNKISYLPYMPTLYYLYLDGSSVKNVSLPLDKVPKLSTLSLRKSQFADITKLKGTDSIYQLDIYDSMVTKVSPLAYMKKKGQFPALETVYMNFDKIKDEDSLKAVGICISDFFLG